MSRRWRGPCSRTSSGAGPSATCRSCVVENAALPQEPGNFGKLAALDGRVERPLQLGQALVQLLVGRERVLQADGAASRLQHGCPAKGDGVFLAHRCAPRFTAEWRT